MVKTGHDGSAAAVPDELRDVQFHNPRLSRLGVEVMDLSTLRSRAGDALAVPERVDFLLLLLVCGGRGRHMVDFVEHALKPGQLLAVRPGQVQQWRTPDRLDGELLLVSPAALAPSIARAGIDMQLLALDEWPAVSTPPKPLFDDALADVARLQADIGRFDGDSATAPLDAAIVWHGLLALLLRLARGRQHAKDASAAPAERAIYRLYLQQLERATGQRLSVRAIAAQIGYSERTLSRACEAAVGRTAKQVADARTVLEAKRLLVHSGASAVQIGHRLGFSEPTNFVKFFRRLAGVTPQAFREAHAPVRAPAGPHKGY